ncbi:ABC transporter substrate-binding protein [Tessaracoccus aquimaris]|uniref:ABC transporter substrate-binding protein n=1 Tax=Tessaracoccus aquimaris TaxID=1332264 RepID=A0A1Q2CKX8_9ACTN|nr:sugar ABC transporter substrate-binding protein [Tessaracoccus aquimaris]AQP46768.1 ABC transporter substrate-binding protein [Tessaracoccus aquimaris]
MSIRRVLAAALTGAVAVGLAACSPSAEGEGGNKSVNVVLANHPWTDLMKEKIPEFEQQSGIKVNLTTYTEDQLSQQLNVKLNAGASDVDVMMIRPLQEARLFDRNKWLADLAEKAQGDAEWDWSDFQPGPQESVTIDGRIVAVPLSTEREVLYYRKDLLDQAGIAIPTTLEELEAAAKQIHESSNGEVYGFVARGQLSAAVTQFSSFLYSSGADWVNEDGTSGIATPEAIAAYELYGRLLREYGPPGVTNMSWPEAMGVFTQGRAAFYAEADSLYTNATDPAKSKVVDSLGFAQFPAGSAGSRPTNVPAWAVAVPSASKNADNAWEFIKWATDKDNTRYVQENGVIGSRASAWDAAPNSVIPADLAEVQAASAKVGVGYSHPVVLNVARSREIVGEPIITAIEGGDVKASAEKASALFDEFLAAGGE